MGTQPISWVDRLQAFHRKLGAKIKTALVNEVPPGVLVGNGDEVPTVAALKAFSERYPLASILPYEAYDRETGLYYNRDTVGFLLYASPGTGVSPTELKTLNGFFNQSHPADTTIQISLIADPNVEPILQRWADTKGNAGDQAHSAIFKTLANHRVDYLRCGKWDSLFSDQAFLIRNFHLVIAYTLPIPHGLSAIEVPNDETDRLVRTRERPSARCVRRRFTRWTCLRSCSLTL